jgi:hypothetical protein
MSSILSGNIPAIWGHSLKSYPDHVAFASCLFDVAEDFLRLVQGDEPNKRILMTVVLSILQDYDEVMAMWALGLGDGAIKLVRPLYEKTLTFAYLARHTDEIQDFVDYSNVHWHKIIAEGAIASPEGENWIPPVEREQIERKYAEVRERYRMTDCKKCKTTRAMPSWTKKSGPELANDTHPVFRRMHFNGFLAPTLAIHPTFATIATQCRVAENRIGVNHEVIQQDNETAFGVGIAMLFATIVTMDEFFGLGKNELVAQLAERFSAFEKEHPFAPPAAPK